MHASTRAGGVRAVSRQLQNVSNPDRDISSWPTATHRESRLKGTLSNSNDSFFTGKGMCCMIRNGYLPSIQLIRTSGKIKVWGCSRKTDPTYDPSSCAQAARLFADERVSDLPPESLQNCGKFCLKIGNWDFGVYFVRVVIIPKISLWSNTHPADSQRFARSDHEDTNIFTA